MKQYNTRDAVEHDHHIQDSHDINTIVTSAISVKTMEPYCYPLDILVDKELLIESWFDFFHKIGHSYKDLCSQLRDDFVKKYEQLGNPTDPIAWDMNLSYMPGLVGDNRWRKFRGTIDWVREEGGDPKLASELLEELDGTYLGTLIKQIFDHHTTTFNREFKGQVNVLWVGPGQRYNFHNDSNLYLRYHVPIITHPDVNWIFQDNNVYYKMHMPFGEVWMLNPVDLVHTVYNQWDTPRAHLVISEFR